MFTVTDFPDNSSKTLLADVIVFQKLGFSSNSHSLYHINCNLYSLYTSGILPNTYHIFSSLFTL